MVVYQSHRGNLPTKNFNRSTTKYVREVMCDDHCGLADYACCNESGNVARAGMASIKRSRSAAFFSAMHL